MVVSRGESRTEGLSRREMFCFLVFETPLATLTPQTFMEPGIVFRIGIPPRRIDFLATIDRVAFVEAYKDKKEFELEELLISFLSNAHLIQKKIEATERKKSTLMPVSSKNILAPSVCIIPTRVCFPKTCFLFFKR